jgi:acetolactate synthase I/II/III large subunit
MNGAQVVAEILKREGTDFLSCYPRNPVIEPCAANTPFFLPRLMRL